MSLTCDLAVPDPPRNPVLVSNDVSHVKIEWEVPEHDGGAAVVGYHVERKECSVATWTRLNNILVSVWTSL